MLFVHEHIYHYASGLVAKLCAHMCMCIVQCTKLYMHGDLHGDGDCV